MTTEITDRVLEERVKAAKIELDTIDSSIAAYEVKLVSESAKRQTVLDRIAALVADFPTLQRIVDEHDAPKEPPPPIEPE